MLMTSVEIDMLIHGFLASIALIAATWIIGVLRSKELSSTDVNRLKWVSVVTVLLVFGLVFTAAYGYMYYRARIPTSARSIILGAEETGLSGIPVVPGAPAPWAHEVVFESMENVGLLGPLIATAIAYFIWHYKADVIQPDVKRALLIMLVIGIIWGLVLIGEGVIPTRIAAAR